MSLSMPTRCCTTPRTAGGTAAFSKNSASWIRRNSSKSRASSLNEGGKTMNKRMIVLIAFLIGLLAFSAAPASAAQVGPVNPNAEPESAPEPDEDAAPVVKKPEAKPGSLVDYAAAGERFGQCTVLEDAVMRLLCFNRIAEDIGYPLNP